MFLIQPPTGRPARLRQAHKDFPMLAVFLSILLCSLLLEWYGHSCHLIHTPDSFHYLAAAQSFREYGQLLDSEGGPYAYWPPLFPAILSLFNDPVTALKWIHVISRILISIFIFFLAKKSITDTGLKALFLAVAIGGVQFMMVSVFLWSEMIFMLLAFSTVYCAGKIENSKTYFVFLLLSGFLLCLQRNAGIFWMASVSLWLLLDNKTAWQKKIRDSLICFIVSTSGFWVWNLYNSHFQFSGFSIYHPDYLSSLAFNLSVILTALGKLFLPFSGTIGLIISVSVLTTIGLLLKNYLLKNRRAQLIVVIVLGYCAGYLTLSALDTNEMDRYIAPVVPLFYWLVLVALDVLFLKMKRCFRAVIFILTIFWAAYPITRTIKNTFLWHKMSCEVSVAR